MNKYTYVILSFNVEGWWEMFQWNEKKAANDPIMILIKNHAFIFQTHTWNKHKNEKEIALKK